MIDERDALPLKLVALAVVLLGGGLYAAIGWPVLPISAGAAILWMVFR